MIEHVIERWHAYVRGEQPDALGEMLADDVVFYSPVVYTPQVGRAITEQYLRAAGVSLAGAPRSAEGGDTGRFRYTKEVLAGNTAVLEFETTVDGKYVNGVDIIRCDDDGKIVEFRVMVRPLQAVNAVHAAMKAMLQAMQPLQ